MRWPLFLFGLLGGCSAYQATCQDVILEAKPDFDGGLVAYRYVRDCGATADFATHIAIGKRGEGLARAEQIFAADSDHGKADMDGRAIWSEMHWTRPRQLSVAYAEKARVFTSRHAALGATIAFRATSRSFMPPTPIMHDYFGSPPAGSDYSRR